jgi:thiamine kinase-like enzyme
VPPRTPVVVADVRDAIARVPGWSPDEVAVESLVGGLTNANYLITRGAERFVLRISGPNAQPLGIDRAAEARATDAAAAARIGPEVIHACDERGLLVTRFIDGAAPSDEAMRTPAMIARVADLLRRVHAIPVAPNTPSYCPFRRAERWADEAERRGAVFPNDFPVLIAQIRAVERDRPAPPAHQLRFCHNDPVRGNIIDDGTLRLIDWEYAGIGDAVFDLAVVSMNNRYDNAQDLALLSAYFHGDVTSDHLRNLRALKLAFDFHMGVWYVLQTVVGTIDAPFARGVHWHFDRLRRNLHVEAGSDLGAEMA